MGMGNPDNPLGLSEFADPYAPSMSPSSPYIGGQQRSFGEIPGFIRRLATNPVGSDLAAFTTDPMSMNGSGQLFADPTIGWSEFTDARFNPSFNNAMLEQWGDLGGGAMTSGYEKYVGVDAYDVTTAINEDIAAKKAAESAANTPAGPGNPASAGGGNWAALDAHDDGFSTAAAATGVNGNVIKAVISVESGMGSSGLSPIVIQDKNGNPRRDANGNAVEVIPWSGITRPAADAYGLDWNRLQTDYNYNIYGVGVVIANISSWSADPGMDGVYGSGDEPIGGPTILEAYGEEGVFATYFLGTPIPTGKADEHGNVDTVYVQNVMSRLNELESRQVQPTGQPQTFGQAPQYVQEALTVSVESGFAAGMVEAEPPPVATVGVSQMGTAPFPGISQGLGLADPYAQEQEWGDYVYAKQYGMSGHAGVDIPWARGTGVVAPVSGKVVTVGMDADGSYSFVDDGNPNPNQSGKLAIQVEGTNDLIILGHLSDINVQVGQNVQAGQPVGLVGTSGTGDHLHLEVRQFDEATGGYKIVDPFGYLGY